MSTSLFLLATNTFGSHMLKMEKALAAGSPATALFHAQICEVAANFCDDNFPEAIKDILKDFSKNPGAEGGEASRGQEEPSLCPKCKHFDVIVENYVAKCHNCGLQWSPGYTTAKQIKQNPGADAVGGGKEETKTL